MLVSEFKKIAKHYLKNNFIFDILAWIPFEYIFPSHSARLWRLLKILRMPKLADLLDVEKIKQIVSKYFEKKILSEIE